MTAKEYLQQARNLNGLINALHSQVLELRTQAESISVNITREKVQTSLQSDKTENIIVKIVDSENEINSMIDEYVELKKEILRMIKNLDNNIEKTILIQRYINNKKWEEIAEKTGYTRVQVNRLHKKALAKLFKKNKDVTKCS